MNGCQIVSVFSIERKVVLLNVHVCEEPAPLYTVIKNAIFKNRSSSIDLYLLPS